MAQHDYQDLYDKLARGQLALFLGADLPRAVTGLPARAELAQGLAARHGLGAGLSWAQAAQRAARGGFVNDLIRYLGDELEPPRRRPARLHELIVRLGAPVVLTTAYDDLLKLAYEKAGVAFNHVVDDADVPFIQAGRPTLLRLYGALSRRGSLVLTEDDQYGLLRDRRKEALLGEVRGVLAKHTILFLGYDLADPDFHFLWREVLERAGKFALGAYAVWPGLPEGERRVWEERRVRVIDAEPLAVLEALVGTRPAPSPPAATPAAAPKYEIHIGQGTGVVIGDGAQVNQQIGGEAPRAGPAAVPAVGAGQTGRMDYPRGFQRLQEYLAQTAPARMAELATLEERFQKNERAERLYGGSENTRHERSQIIHALNVLALETLGISFNDLCMGVPYSGRPAAAPGTIEPLPTTGPVQQPVPEISAAPRIPFQLQLTRRGQQKVEVRALQTPLGEPHAVVQLPYTEVELSVVLKALRLRQYTPETFPDEQREILAQLGFLLAGDQLDPAILWRVGQTLYDTLMAGEINTAFQMALNQIPGQGVVSLQLRFDEDAVELARYPWELLYCRQPLLPSGAVELTRYISYAQAASPLGVTPPLRLLYIQSRPRGVPTLANTEQKVARQALAPLQEEGLLQVDTLPRPTFEGLLDYLESYPVHILHFDGHGVFARRCPVCGELNAPTAERCWGQKGGRACGRPLAQIAPQGYLAFVGPGRKVDPIGSVDLATLLSRRGVRLAVLSACWSGAVRGETLFGGVAPALIQAGLPAVVATQLPIGVDAAARFAQGFYRALSRFETLPAAVNAGRIRILNTQEWFIPTLYLRSQDSEGRLFVRQGG